MVKVTVNGEEREYEPDTTYQKIAEDFQCEYPYDIVLAFVDDKLAELCNEVKKDCTLRFLTTADKPGFQAYQRSAVFLMLRSFYDVVGDDRIDNVTVNFSVGKGLFVEPHGDFTLTDELIAQVKDKMDEYVARKLPITKRTINVDDSIEYFSKIGMPDKAQLLAFRRSTSVNIYSLDGFDDYFYGYMVPDTGYIKYYDLFLYEHGFVLMLPSMEKPDVVPEFSFSPKLFSILTEASDWGAKMGIPNIGALNREICNGRANELILIQEALQEKKIGQIAEEIVSRPNRKIVLIAGPSSSGKTTFAHRLSIQLEALGKKPHPISTDDYFVNREDTPVDENGEYDFEALECVDLDQFNRDMKDLLNGKSVSMPHFNFMTGMREYNGELLTLGSDDILVIEGIHSLNERLSAALPKEDKFKIYISALTQLNIDEHNRIPTTDGRLIRRMVRDARTRNNSAQETIRMWPSVRAGEENNIFPYQEEADVMFNSALVYELSVLKQYAEPLLFSIPKDCEEYVEAKRLLKFFDYVVGIDSENIPKNSLIREFIGGSCFNV